MRRQDADGEKANGEKRRIAGKLSYEDAILAHENIGVSNRAKVVQMRQKVSVVPPAFNKVFIFHYIIFFINFHFYFL